MIIQWNNRDVDRVFFCFGLVFFVLFFSLVWEMREVFLEELKLFLLLRDT